jgi:hypothetical protein
MGVDVFRIFSSIVLHCVANKRTIATASFLLCVLCTYTYMYIHKHMYSICVLTRSQLRVHISRSPILHTSQPKVTTRVGERLAAAENSGSRSRSGSVRIMVDRNVKLAVKWGARLNPVNLCVPAATGAFSFSFSTQRGAEVGQHPQTRCTHCKHV